MQSINVLALGGDGIGPEVLDCGLRVLEEAAAVAKVAIDVQEDLLHGAAWDAYGTFCRDETVEAARASDAILVGAVGGPKWDGITVPGGPELQDGLMRLRFELDTFAGLRPAWSTPCLFDLAPFRRDILDKVDVMVLREMSGGVYFSKHRGEENVSGVRIGFDTTSYSETEIERFAHVGFQLAARRRQRLVSVDKANVMASGVVWRETVARVSKEYPDVAVQHMFMDNAVYQLNMRPAEFDVILSDNLFGDILSDQTGAFSGALGVLPSACLPGLPIVGNRMQGIYEAVHGSAPDIAGKGIANPLGTILSVAMLFRYSVAAPDVAGRIEAAVDRALIEGKRTADLGGTCTSSEVTDAVISAFRTF